MRKMGLICLALVLALGASGVGYATWSETLAIAGTTGTGEVDWYITSFFIQDTFDPADHPGVFDWNSGDGFDPVPYRVDKNVGWGSGFLVDGPDDDGDMSQLDVTLHNVYPSYFNKITVYVQNNGSIPLMIESVTIRGGIEIHRFADVPSYAALDLDGDEKDDIEICWRDNFGEQLHPDGAIVALSFWFHALEDAPQGATLSFTIEVEAVQWNEYAP